MTKVAKNTKQSKEFINVEIISTKPSDFYITDIEDELAENTTIKDLDLKLEVVSLTNRKDKLFKFELIIDVYLKKDNKPEEGKGLFGIKSSTVFNIPEFGKISNKEDDIIAPDEFIKKLFNISIGATRGMLSVYLENTPISHITLPLLDIDMDDKNRKPIEDEEE